MLELEINSLVINDNEASYNWKISLNHIILKESPYNYFKRVTKGITQFECKTHKLEKTTINYEESNDISKYISLIHNFLLELKSPKDCFLNLNKYISYEHFLDILKLRLKYFDEPLEIIQSGSFDELLTYFRK